MDAESSAIVLTASRDSYSLQETVHVEVHQVAEQVLMGL